MPKTVITAPRKQEKARPVAPPRLAESSVPPETQPAAPTLDELQAIEQRLQDGLAALQGSQEGHRAALEGIPAALAELAQQVHQAEARVTALQQEQDLLPRRLNGARAVLIGATGTPGESAAQAEIDRLLARQEALPHELAAALAAEQETRATGETDRERIEAAAAEHRAELATLAGLVEALRDQAAAEHRAIGQAKLEQVKAERQVKQAALDAAEAQAAEARAALSAGDTAALAALQQWPDLRLQYQQLMPVDDLKVQRLRALLEYHRSLASWMASPNWSLDMNYAWFFVPQSVIAYPEHISVAVHEMEKALARHIAEVQQRPR